MRTSVMVNSFLICQRRKQLVTIPWHWCNLPLSQQWKGKHLYKWRPLLPQSTSCSLSPSPLGFASFPAHVHCLGALAKPQMPTALGESPAAVKCVYSWFLRSSMYSTTALPLLVSKVVSLSLFLCLPHPLRLSLMRFHFTHLFIQQLVIGSVSGSIQWPFLPQSS